MPASWVRKLFPLTAAANRKARRAHPRPAAGGRRGMFVEVLEDRVVPDGSAPSLSFSNKAVTVFEGDTFTRGGKVLDFDDEQIDLTTNVAGAIITPPGFAAGTTTSFQNFTFSFSPANGNGFTAIPLSKTLTATDGPVNPLAISATFPVSVLNVAPAVAAPAAQVAVTGKPIQLNLGQLTDPGLEPSYSVEVDLDYDGFTFTTDQTFGLAGGVKSAHVLSTLNAGGFATAKTYTVAVRVTDDTDTSAVSTFSVVVVNDLATTYADDSLTELNNTSGGTAGVLEPGDEVAVPGFGTKVFGYDAWKTIQQAVGVTSTAGTVRVLAGSYAEAVTLSKAVSLLGPNEGISAGKTPGVRVAEAVLTSPVANLTGSLVGIVSVSASNVTIDGLSVNGDNTLIPGGVAVLGGADSNAKRGVAVGAADNVIVRNTIFANLYGRGVQYEDVAGDAAVGGTVADNSFTNIGDAAGADGYALLVFDSTPSFTGNASSNINYGTNYQFIYTDPTPINVTGNDLAVIQMGLGVNETGGAAGLITLGNNTVSVSGAKGLGVNLWSVAHAGGVAVSNNVLTGSGGTDSRGINAWTGTGAMTVPVTDGSVSGFTTAVYVANEELIGPFGNATAAVSVGLTDVTVSLTAGGKGVYVWDTPAGTQPVSVTLSGVSLIGSGSGTGVRLDGPLAALGGDTLADTDFSAFTGTSRFVGLANAAYAAGTVAGTAAKYNGVLGSALTRTSSPTGFAVEDRIDHVLDAAGVGFVRTTAATTFVTPASGSIQRAIDVSAVSGDTVFVDAGTYAENLNVNKGIALRGPNDTLTPNSGTRLSPGVPEAVITGSGLAFQLSSAPVGAAITIAGFKLTGTGGTLQQQAFGAGGTTITFEKNWADGRGQMYVDDQKLGGGTTTLTVDDNRFVSSGGNAMQIHGTPGTSNFTNATITNNFVDGTVNAGLNTDGLTSSLISDNTFTNTAQQGVQIAGPAAGVTVQNNTFDTVNTSGALNRGAIRISSAALGGAVSITGNTITTGDAKNGIFINSTANLTGGSLTISGNTISGQSVAALNHTGVGTASVTGGTITVPGTSAGMIVNGASAVLSVSGGTIGGAAAFTGISLVAGTLNVSGGTITGALPTAGSTGIAQSGGTATISGGTVRATTTGIDFTGGTASVAGVDFDDATDNSTDLEINAAGLTIGAANQFAGDTYFIDNQSATSYVLTGGNAQSYDESNNFRIEDRIGHRVDTDRGVGTGLVTWVTDNVYVTAPGGGTDSSIQRGVDAVPDASTGWTVNVEAGSYDLAATEASDFVLVNEDVTVLGAGAGATTVTRLAAAAGGQTYLFGVAANGVTVQGFTFATVRPFANDGILGQKGGVVLGATNTDTGSFDDLLIQDNVFTASGTGGPSVHTGGSGRGIPVALLDGSGTNHADVALKGNWIKSGAEAGTGVDFTRGLWSYAPMLTVGGPAVADGNKFYGTFQSALMQFPSITPSLNSTMLVQNNTFTGNVAEVTEPNGGVNVQITQNTFGITFGTRGNVFVNHNYSAGATVTISQNQFTVANNTIGVFLGGSKAVTVEDNTFDAVAGATSFAYVMADSQFRNGSNPLASVSNFVIQGNAFNGGTVAGGVGIDLYNGNASVGFDGATVGGAGADANSFGANLSKFIALNTVRNPIMAPEAGGSPAFGPFDLNFDASGNTYDVGGGQELPAAMDLADLYALEQKLTHKPDATALGRVTVVANNIYVPAGTNTIQGGIDAVPDGSTGWTVNVQAGTFTENVLVNEDVTLVGAQVGVDPRPTDLAPRGGGETVVRPAASDAANGNIFTVSKSGVTIDGFTIQGSNTALDIMSPVLAINGVQVHAGRGVANGADPATPTTNWTPVNNLVVRNNIVKDFGRYGIGLYNENNPAVSSGGAVFTRNVIDNMMAGTGSGIAGSATSFGVRQGIFLRHNAYATVTDNEITRAARGVHIQQAYVADPVGGTGYVVTGNDIQSTTTGIYQVLQYQAASPTTISNNTVNSLGATNNAIAIFTVQDTVNPTVSNNTIMAGALNGYVVWMTSTNGAPATGGLTISGGSVTGATGNGVVLTNDITGLVGAPFSTQSGRLNLSGVTLTNNATGVRVYDNPSNPNSPSDVALSLSNVTITGGTTGLVIDGVDAKLVGDTVGNTVFSGLSGNYITLAGGAYNAAANAGTPVLSAASADFDGVVGGSATLAQAFAIEDKITHQIDSAAQGFVQLQANKAFVTGATAVGGIQRGINAEGITAGGKVYAQSGTYDEDIAMAVSSGDLIGLQLLGEGAGTTTIRGVVGGPGLTVTIGTSQVIDGFTITRANPANTPGENTIALSNIAGSTGFVVSNNVFTQNRTAIYVTGSGQGTYTRNVIDNNRTGILFAESNNGAYLISENVISNNRTFGILFTPGAAVIDPGLLITNNSITGNFATQLENNSPVAVNAPGNWFGSNVLTTYSGSLNSDKLAANLDGNGNPFSWAYPGPVAAPGAPMPYSVSGTNLANTDFTPFLWVGTDTAPSTNGFQGDFSVLGVTTQGGQIQPGGRINEGIAYNGGSATTVNVRAGSYAEPLDLSRAVVVRLQGDVTVDSLQSTGGGTGRQVDANGFDFTYGDAADLAFNGVFVGTGGSSVIKQGTGTSTLTGDSSGYTGNFDVNGGTLLLSTGTTKLGGAVNVNAGGTLAGVGRVGGLLTNAGTVSPGDGGSGTLTAAGGYTQSAAGTLVVQYTGANGNVAPVAGTDYDQLDVTGGIDLNGGTLSFNAAGNAPADFKSLTFIRNDSTDPITGSSPGFAGKVGGTVYDFGGGNLYLVSYAGDTGNDFVLLKVNTGGALPQVYVDDSWAALPGGTAVTTPDGTAFVDFNAFGTLAGGLGKQASGGLIDLSSGTYAGGVALTTGTLRLRNNPADPSPLGVVVTGTLTTTAGTTLNLNRTPLTVSGGSLAGVVSGLGLSSSLTNAGGALVLSNPANSYKGSTTVSGGSLTLGGDEVIPDGSLVTVTGAGSTFDLAGFLETVGGLAGDSAAAVTLGTAGELYVGANNGNATFAGAVSGPGSVVKVGTGTQTLSGPLSYTGSLFTPTPTSVYSGTLVFGGSAAVAGDIATTGGTVAFNGPASVSGVISGTGGVLVLADTTLSGANSYTGGTTVSGGKLSVAGTGNLGATTGVVTVTAGSVSLGAGTYTNRTFNLSGGGSLSAAGAVLLAGTTVSGGSLTGPGTFATTGGTGSKFVGVTFQPSASVSINDTSAATKLQNVTLGGSLTVQKTVTASLLNATVAASGRLTVYGTATADGLSVGGYVEVSKATGAASAGVLQNTGANPITVNGGTLAVGYSQAPLGGGGPVGTVGKSESARQARGYVDIGAGGLALNNGAIAFFNGLVGTTDLGGPSLTLNFGSQVYFPNTDTGLDLSVDTNIFVDEVGGKASKGTWGLT